MHALWIHQQDQRVRPLLEAYSCKVLLPVSLVVHIVDFYVMWLHCVVLGNVVRVTLDCTGSYVLLQ